MKLRGLFLLLVTITCLASACGGDKPPKNIVEFVENCLQKNLPQEHLACYDSAFFQVANKDIRLKQMQNLHNSLGNAQSISLESWTLHTQKDIGKIGNFYVLNYNNSYQKAKAKETIIIFQDSASNKMSILTRNINCDVLSNDPFSIN